MKLKFLFFAALWFLFQFVATGGLNAQEIMETKSASVKKTKFGTKLNELPDPKSISWKKNIFFGDQLFQRGSYYNGLHYYEEALQKNPSKTSLNQTIADGNFALRDYKTANKYYKALVGLDSATHTNLTALYQYALTDKYMGNYEKAKANFELFNQYAKDIHELDDARKKATLEMQGCDLGIKLRDDNTYKETKITHLENNINQPFTDYAPVLKDASTLYYGSLVSDKVIFTGKGEKYATFSKLYTAKRNGATWNKGELAAGDINNVSYHVGNPTFTADGKTMYYTQCLQDDKQQMRCDIYKSYLGNEGWIAGIKLDANVNMDGATNTQPALGKNEAAENVLYFVSDRNKGKGLDIFSAKINENGNFSKARELSTAINTDENEETPFYDFQTNTFYFSSDGRVNIGGLDVYKAKAQGGKWSEPENLGLPVNSSVDDMYFNWTEREGLGFVVSNRPGGYGLKSETCCDDIYQVYVHKIFLAVKGTVIDGDSNQLMPGQAVTLYDGKTGASIKTDAAANGSYFFDLQPDKTYKVTSVKDGYFTAAQNFSTVGKDNSDTMNFVLSLKKMEKNKAYTLNNIYYEFNKADLTPQSKAVLDTLNDILRDNPNIVIELSSHTDGKGTHKYNVELSQKRAESCVTYLTEEKGIPKERIVAKGYGETMPVADNTNPDGSDNPDGRAKNRRTEFKIIDELKKP